MNCAELMPLLTRTPLCAETELGTQLQTTCLYPSSDPVNVYIARLRGGFRVHDGGGAMRSAILHCRNWQSALERAGRRHSVMVSDGALVARPPDEEWLYPAVLAVANASALAARYALESVQNRSESSLKDMIFEKLKRAVPESKIGKDFEYRGRSGHMWQVDFAVREEGLILVKSVVQNGNSINSNYAAFGDIGEAEEVLKFSVFEQALNPDSEALLRQVAALVPIAALTQMVHRQAYRNRLR